MAILTIARKYGSGGREIGQAVAKQMNYEYIDRGKILVDMRAEGKQWEEEEISFSKAFLLYLGSVSSLRLKKG